MASLKGQGAGTSLVGRKVELKPTQGAYQKTIAGTVVGESATQFTVEAPGFAGKKFRKDDGMPVAKVDRQFPCYKAVVQV